MIFARPNIFGTLLLPIIVDGERRFLGELPIRSWFATTLPPGRHTFIVFFDEQHAMRAHLEAGRIYVVTVPITFTISFAGTGRPNLCAVRPDDAAWRDLPSWLSQRRLEPQVAQGQQHLNRFREEMDERVALGFREVAELDETDTCRRHIEPGDGILGPLPVPHSESMAQ